MRLQHFSSGRTGQPRKATLFIGATLALGLSATAFTPSAQAANVTLGGVEIQIDTTVSMGATFLMSDRDNQFLPISNGGPADISSYGAASPATKAVVDARKAGEHGAVDEDGDFLENNDGNPVNPAEVNAYNMLLAGTAIGERCNEGYGGYCQEIIAKPNFDGSINTDDGRLNFDNGDVVSAPFKITSEAEAFFGNFTAFGRINAFYDAALMDETSFTRAGLDNKGISNAGRNIELLDLYLDYDGEVGTMPFTIRAGRQVINWGEATFVPGGNSAFSPIDVAAIRRPGAEIKEALLPVEALYGSIAITQDITVEAYVGGWEEFKLDAGGTLFGGSDAFTPGVRGANPHNVYFIGGGYRSGDQFACDGAAPLAVLGAGADGDAALADDNLNYYLASASIINAVTTIDGAVNCDGNPNLNSNRTWTTGRAEAERAASGDTNIVRGLDNDDGDESVGLAIRWYAENLNSTEFALYYQKVDSRLPYISYRTGKSDIKAGSLASQASTVGRGAGVTGCIGSLVNAGLIAAGTPGAKAYNPAYAAVTIDDSKNLLGDPGIQAIANDAAAGVGPLLNALSGGAITSYARSAPEGDNIAYFQETVCLLTLAQRNGDATLGSGLDGAGQLHTGATNLSVTPNIGLLAEYPEVEIIGLSFNTTAFGWGVQGDFTHRPEMPLQIDTDALTISALFNNCAFTTVGVLEGLYQSGATYGNDAADRASRQNVGCTDQNRYMQGWTTEHDAYTWDIGTTATFTRSSPLISFFGADLGVLLTEFQGVIAEDIEEERGNTGGLIDPATGMYPDGRGIAPLSNVCQGGSDLPLNGILSIDDRSVGDASDPSDNNPKGFCRPTDHSWGAVLFAQLQYNNAFGTPFSLNPTIVWSEGLEGYSPSPLGFWREGVGSTSFRLDSRYLSKWQMSLAYTDYHGDKERTRNLDRNTLSASVSYAF